MPGYLPWGLLEPTAYYTSGTMGRLCLIQRKQHMAFWPFLQESNPQQTMNGICCLDRAVSAGRRRGPRVVELGRLPLHPTLRP